VASQGAAAGLERWGFALGLAGAFLLAFVVRLTGILRGGGLYGLGNYDDGVHFGAALGLVNGLLPYRDFLLLHPPAVVLALAPFAALSWVIGEPHAMAVARLAWMAVGALNTVLCALVIRPLGRIPALVTALFYALCIGAVYVEHTTLHEPLATTMLLLALVITRILGSGELIDHRHYVLAGLLLGVSPAVKIWGAVVVVVVVGCLAARRGWRPAATVLGAAAASCAVLCLPFFLAAPGRMWQMVVTAQVGRRRVAESPIKRLDDILGSREWETARALVHSVFFGAMLFAVTAALVICLIRAELRVLAALLISHGVLVMTTPMWFLHYAGMSAAPIALALGGALSAVLSWGGSRRWWLPLVSGTAAGAVLVLAIPMTRVDLGGRPFPAQALAERLRDHPGCLTHDYPMALIQMDLLQRDIDRGCRFVVDLGGYSYYLVDSPDARESRRRNEDWQVLALEYYRTGEAAIAIRFSAGRGFSRRTARTIDRWPVIVQIGEHVVREPQPPPR
jgi:alpha-1,2-mannosyltransferase